MSANLDKFAEPQDSDKLENIDKLLSAWEAI
ncbi:hypothetical protein SVI_4109 [Shewanella violacea DSS12]|uniref:Uncharacterized protein n=1 Tax=Shewanella violacea (strain JCM 10179 / CIP 106290 / LMG 19151 / DSS12) TaxID=637905 RepID=D4ZE19_SHEVD|nr:hypothetical protein SVI_4109 [Shewanella violacea DSS12]